MLFFEDFRNLPGEPLFEPAEVHTELLQYITHKQLTDQVLCAETGRLWSLQREWNVHQKKKIKKDEN